MNKTFKCLYTNIKTPFVFTIFDGSDEEFESITDFFKKEWREETGSKIHGTYFLQLHRNYGPAQIYHHEYYEWSIHGQDPRNFFNAMFPICLFQEDYPNPSLKKDEVTK